MDLPPTNCSMGEDARADPAFMLFGKQIKGQLIKEELSPRGVDERGVSLATSSDEEEDVNASVEATCKEAMVIHNTIIRERHKRDEEEDPMEMGSAQIAQEKCEGESPPQWKKHNHNAEEGDCPPMQVLAAKQQWDKQQSTYDEGKSLGGAYEVEKLTNSERDLILKGDSQAAATQKSGLWSRCPRCNSGDTKFCYFNNYNVNQPRHFCKHCQRYWTAGGTLRNVPVGAGKRKNKQALRKEAFFMSPLCTSNSTTAALDATDNANLNVDCHIISEMSRMPSVNTDLKLAAHQSASSSITLSSHKPHSLATLQQLQMGLPSKSSPFGPTLANGSSTSSQASCMPSRVRPLCPDLATEASQANQMYPCGISKFNQIPPSLADVRSKLTQLSAGLSQTSPHLPSSDLSQIHPPLPEIVLPESAKTNSTFNHGLKVDQSSPKRSMSVSDSSVKGGGLAHNNLWGPNLWPYFYNMYWLDSCAPLGSLSHLKPILTPQGWAFPFIPPSLETSSSTTNPILEKCVSPYARSPLTIDTSSTCSTPTTPSMVALNSTNAKSATVSNDVAIPSCGKRHADISNSGHYASHHKSSKCSKSEF